MSDYKPPQSADEVLSRYCAGERYFGHSELDGSILDFHGVNLAEADFSQSYLFADFRDTNLQSANFTQCNIKTCDFRGADLQGALFCEACIDSAEFTGALLTGADFEGAYISGYTMLAGEQPSW